MLHSSQSPQLTELISLNPSHSPLFLHLLLPSQMSFSSLFLFLSWICVLLNCLHVGLSGPIMLVYRVIVENNQKFIWLVVSTPLKNISQLGWLFPIYGKIKMFQTTNQSWPDFPRHFSNSHGFIDHAGGTNTGSAIRPRDPGTCFKFMLRFMVGVKMGWSQPKDDMQVDLR